MSPDTEAELHKRVRALEAENQRLRDAQAEVVNAAKLASLGMLVAGVAHELNTPLGALHSNHDVLQRALRRLANILADDVVEPSELEELRRIVRALGEIMEVDGLAVGRMVQLVGSLRSFGRLDAAEIDRVDLRTGIESALTLLRHELQDRITVVREYSDLPPVECYPNQLNQLFMNLLLNAAQAIRGPGTITIRTYRNDAEAAVEIRDTGVGIPPENLQRIFEPGFTTKGARVGMGLGLLISRQIVEQHRGRLTVESTVGQGTAFTAFLPFLLSRGVAATAEP